ncbi:hypothetical protein [Hymenobacter sp. B81]|uniref:hypothetical protein n=1 Tax=Hymenobacter sp. B81 TaxID=3344878 RepID=UPI0037DC8E69
MESLRLGKTAYQVPSTWNELTRRQLLEVVRVLYGPENALPRKLRLLSVLTGAPLSLLISFPGVQVVQLYALTDFVFDNDHRLTEQLLPVVRTGLLTWAGPRSSFRNLLFGEFIFADTYFRAWATGRSAEALDLFLACLYRVPVRGLSPRDPRWRGDRRVPFNEHRLEYYARQLKPLPDDVKLAITTWYRGCRGQLEREFPEVFDVHEEDAHQHKQHAGDWGRVLRKLSGGAFGTLEQTALQHTRTILAEMQDAARDYERAKKQAPR